MKKFYLLLSQTCFVILLCCSRLWAQQNDFKDFQQLILKNAGNMGISRADAESAVITSAYTDERTHVTFIYLQQAYQQIKVYNTIISAAFIEGSFQYASGSFVKEIATKAGSAVPAKTAANAVEAAATYLGLTTPGPLAIVSDQFATSKAISFIPGTISRQNIDATLYWTPSDDKQSVRLTWNVNIDEKRSADWWNVRIDAQTGAYVQKDNWTVDEQMPDQHMLPAIPLAASELAKQTIQSTNAKRLKKQETTSPQIVLQAPPPTTTSATYRVIPYPIESPLYGSFANVNNPWLMAGAGNSAITLGWHFDSTANYNTTRGNNVFAFLDRKANDVADAQSNWPDTSATEAPTLTFVHNQSTVQQPLITENKKAAIDNLFYWNNLMHDVMYQYGFTEAAGNFQKENLGRGGAGNDFVNANAQDSSGYSNANFSTPTDGTNGRMQMYLFQTPPVFSVTSPSSIAGNYGATESNFAAPNKLLYKPTITGQVVYYNDDTAATIHNGCGTTAAANATSIAGKVALIDITTGSCSFISRVKKAQTAGAIAALLYYPVLGTVGGTDNTVTIPAVVITTATANSIITNLNNNVPVTISLASGIYLDGDLDNGVICHEYGHGISTRLTGGPYGTSCLGNAEQAGEGWSDYLGLMMTTNWSTAGLNDGANARPIGNYVIGASASGAGIRRYPYCTNMTIDPLTYSNMATSTEVHNIGEIWCSAIWDMTWNIIQQVGSITPNLYNSAGAGGNAIALNLVLTGMKLQPCYPGYIDGRNAILAADSLLYGYAHKCAIWAAFARRGMGVSASQGSSNIATDQTVAFDLPSGIQMSRPLPLAALPNTTKTITRTATCDCQAASYVLRDTIPSGFTYIGSSPTGTLSGNVLTFPATAFTAGQSQNFSITLRTPVSGCTIDSVLNDNRENNTTGGFTSSGTSAWTTSTTKAHTPANAWYAPNLVTASSASLTSVATATTALKPLSILSFWHNFRTETNYDGGVIEYSTNGGSTWTDAVSLFIANGYTTAMDASTAFGGRKAFSGNSRNFQFAMLNLASLGTSPVSFRFRIETDAGAGVEGWYVDDIIRANGCGGILNSGIYNTSGVRLDSASVPVFVTPTALPLTLLWFYANQVGSQVALDWRTVSETNVKDFTIEWSTDGTNWSSIGSQTAFNRNSNSYSFIHTSPAAGQNYYRIRMNDVDGKFTYAPVRVISIKDKQPALVLLPNPVNTESVLYLSKDLKAKTVKVYDAAGSLVRQLTIGTGTQQVKIETANLAAGVYTVEANGNSRQVIRMMVQH